jgi:hypothetical protein
MPTGAMLPEVVVETDDAVNLGARQVQAFGYAANGFAGYVTQFLLDSVKDGQQGPRLIGVTGDDAIHRGHTLCIEFRHASSCAAHGVRLLTDQPF